MRPFFEDKRALTNQPVHSSGVVVHLCSSFPKELAPAVLLSGWLKVFRKNSNIASMSLAPPTLLLEWLRKCLQLEARRNPSCDYRLALPKLGHCIHPTKYRHPRCPQSYPQSLWCLARRPSRCPQALKYVLHHVRVPPSSAIALYVILHHSLSSSSSAAARGWHCPQRQADGEFASDDTGSDEIRREGRRHRAESSVTCLQLHKCIEFLIGRYKILSQGVPAASLSIECIIFPHWKMQFSTDFLLRSWSIALEFHAAIMPFMRDRRFLKA